MVDQLEATQSTFQSKVYSKADFQTFMDTATSLKDFNDCITFNKGKAYFRSLATMIFKVECNCDIDIEFANLTKKLSILSAYTGETIEIGKDDRGWIINNGQDIIKFPFDIDSFKLTEAEYNQKFEDNIPTDNLLFSWDITMDKYNAIKKYMDGFGTSEINLRKDADSSEIKLSIGDPSIVGTAQISSFDLSLNDYKALNDERIITNCKFEFWNMFSKGLNKLNISVYYNAVKDWICFVSNVETEYAKIQMFRVKPRVSNTILS